MTDALRHAQFVAHLDNQPPIHGWDKSGNHRCLDHPWHRSNWWHEKVYPKKGMSRG